MLVFYTNWRSLENLQSRFSKYLKRSEDILAAAGGVTLRASKVGNESDCEEISVFYRPRASRTAFAVEGRRGVEVSEAGRSSPPLVQISVFFALELPLAILTENRS